jgi:hypothetical protein
MMNQDHFKFLLQLGSSACNASYLGVRSGGSWVQISLGKPARPRKTTAPRLVERLKQ